MLLLLPLIQTLGETIQYQSPNLVLFLFFPSSEKKTSLSQHCPSLMSRHIYKETLETKVPD